MENESRRFYLLNLVVIACVLGLMFAAGRASAESGGRQIPIPIPIQPGEALGPVKLGVPVASLAAIGPPVETLPGSADTAFLTVGPYHVRACGGRVTEVWLDDLRKTPLGVSYNGSPIAPSTPRDAVIARFQGCHDTPPRIGGAFTECENGGVRLGYGMGDFLQVRVAAKGTRLDDECADTLDDGHAVPLSAADKADLLQRVLDLDVLSPYWHPDRPGRSPLPMLRNDAVSDVPPLHIFAYPVAWTEAPAPGAPVFEITSIESTARRVTIRFRWAVEGVSGEARFRRRFNSWVLDSRSVAER